MKKRKIDNECRVFNNQWRFDYFVSEHKGNALCLICHEAIAVLKEYNIRRHYQTKHFSQFSSFTGNQRNEKYEDLKRSMSIQQLILTKSVDKNEAATKASFRIAHLLAKRMKPFSDGELIKTCILSSVEEMCPEKLSIFKNLTLSTRTIADRTVEIAENITSQLKNKSRNFKWFSIAVDESTDISDNSVLLVFIRGINNNVDVCEELALVSIMHDTTKGEDIFKEIEMLLGLYNLRWEQLKSVTTDGGRNMCGVRNGLIGHIYRICENFSVPKPLVFHCIIHQEALCVKHIDLLSIINPVTKAINYIRSSTLRHRQFHAFLEDIQAEYKDVPYHTPVRWLSSGKVIFRFFELRNEIKTFLNERNFPMPLLENVEWLSNLAFTADIFTYLDELNLRLQGETSLICDLYSKVKAFRLKLNLFEAQLKSRNFIHFPCFEKLLNEVSYPFPITFAEGILTELKLQFDTRFIDLDGNSKIIAIFQNPFSCNIIDAPDELQLELIDLQANENYKYKFKEGNLIEFYKLLPKEEYKCLKEFAIGMISIFGTTYSCEKTFSKLKYVKSSHRSLLSDKHLESILRISSTNIETDYESILSKRKQFHPSH